MIRRACGKFARVLRGCLTPRETSLHAGTKHGSRHTFVRVSDTVLLSALTLATAAILVPAVYVGYQATIVGNPPDTLCAATPPGDRVARRAVGFSTKQRWTWWTPKYAFTCIYDMPDGSTTVRKPR